MTDVPEEPGVEPPATGRAALVLAISIAVILAIASVSLGVVAAHRSNGQSNENALRKAASEVGTALLSYDYHNPDAHKTAVLALATGSFRTQYQDAFDQGLRELITKVKAVSVGTVKDIYASQIDSNGAQAIVVADVTTKGVSGTHSLADVYILLTFVHVNGAWKVDDVTDLNFSQADQALGSSASSTTTTTASTPTRVP